MNLGTARTILRRRLKDGDSQLWSDAVLDILINEAIMSEQSEALKSDPNAHQTIWTSDLEAGQQYYDIPDGMVYETSIGISDSSANTGFRSLERMEFFDLRKKLSGGDNLYYSRFSNKFFIGPPPEEDVTDGLQIIGIPSLSASEDDSVVLPLHIALHWGVVLRAQIMALGDTDENVDNLWKELAEVRSRIPQIYVRSGGEPEVIRPDTVKDY